MSDVFQLERQVVKTRRKRRRPTIESATRIVRVLNLGAGVQSTCIYMMMVNGDLPKVDYAIFADTGDEPMDVYEHLQWLQCQPGPKIFIRDLGISLSQALIRGVNPDGGRFPTIPAFTAAYDGGKNLGMTKRQCTSMFKIDVINQTIRREILGLAPGKRIPNNTWVVQILGMSSDEQGRIVDTQAAFAKQFRFSPEFPLYDLSMTRQHCEEYNAKHVPHEVPRSACVECPFHSDAEWRRIRSNPVDWEKACEIDEGLRSDMWVASDKLNQKMYLHRSCVPLRQANIDTNTEDDGWFNGGCLTLGMCGR